MRAKAWPSDYRTLPASPARRQEWARSRRRQECIVFGTYSGQGTGGGGLAKRESELRWAASPTPTGRASRHRKQCMCMLTAFPSARGCPPTLMQITGETSHWRQQAIPMWSDRCMQNLPEQNHRLRFQFCRNGDHSNFRFRVLRCSSTLQTFKHSGNHHHTLCGWARRARMPLQGLRHHAGIVLTGFVEQQRNVGTACGGGGKVAQSRAT